MAAGAPVVAGWSRLSTRSWGWLGAYVALSAALLIGVALAVASQEETLERALMGLLFPEKWHGVTQFLLAFVLKAQAQQVVVNLVLLVALNLVSLLLFWAKELLSQSYERDLARRRGEPDPRAGWRELPILSEGLEEIKWTLVGLALTFVVLWVGHAREEWRQVLATILSYAVLFFTTAGNFLAPPLQRRRLRYVQVLQAMARRPLLSLGFGAAMALPQVLVLHLVSGAEMPALASLLVIFAVNIVFISASAIVGTRVGLALLPAATAARVPHWGVRAAGWLAVLGVLGAGGYTGARLGVMVAEKSQVLKCRYAVDWSTLAFERPGLGGLLRGEVTVAVSFEVTIENPNALPVRIENNRLELSDEDVVIAQAHLSPLEVPARGSTRTRVALDAKLRAASLLEGARLDPRAWEVTLYLELEPGLELPVYL